MESITKPTGLHQILDQRSELLTPEMAKVLVDFRADEPTQTRRELLAEKSNEGTLTPDEAREYSEAVRAGTLVSILQAKARKVLQQSKGA